MIDVVGASLVDELSIRQRVEHVEILSRRRIDVRIEVVVTQKLILVNESVDEMRAVDVECGCHAVSMAENRGKVKRWWTLCGMSQYHRTGCDRLSSCLAQAEGSERKSQHHAIRQRAQRTIAACRVNS